MLKYYILLSFIILIVIFSPFIRCVVSLYHPKKNNLWLIGEELRDKVEGLEDKVANLEEKADNLESKMDNLESKIDTLETKIDEVLTLLRRNKAQ